MKYELIQNYQLNINWNVLHSFTWTVQKNCFTKVKIEKECCRSMEGYRLWDKHKQNWDRVFILLLTQADALPKQMLAAMMLSQHWVSSSRIIRPRTPCHAQCRLWGTLLKLYWSAVCSMEPHSQFGEGARPHLCINKWNRPTPVCRRLTLLQVVRSKPIPTDLVLFMSVKAQSLDVLSQQSVFRL